MKPNTKSLGIKASLFNMLNKKFNNKTIVYQDKLSYLEKKYNYKTFTDKEKIELFDELFITHQACHEELKAYKEKRKFKAKVEEERKKRGFKRKHKTTKAEYEAYLENKERVKQDLLELSK